jgi:cytochrome P450
MEQTMDSATEFLFGESIDSLGAGEKQPSFAKDFNTSQDGLAIRSRLGPLMVFHRDRAFSKATVEARRFVGQFVQKALDYRAAYVDGKDTAKAQGQQYVFIYELSKQTADRTVLTDQILNILLAGRDTTAGILSITFFILARRPDIWNRLRDEVLTVQGERPCFEDLKSMTYLTWVLKESKSAPPLPQRKMRVDTEHAKKKIVK